MARGFACLKVGSDKSIFWHDAVVERDPVGVAVNSRKYHPHSTVWMSFALPLHEDTPVDVEPDHQSHQTDDGETEDQADVVGLPESLDPGQVEVGLRDILLGIVLNIDQGSCIGLFLLLLKCREWLGDDSHSVTVT